MKTLIRFLIVISMVTPHTVFAAEATNDRILRRIYNFVEEYKFEEVTSLDTATLVEPDTLAEKYQQWEQQALAAANLGQNPKSLLEITRGTRENRQLQREAEKIVNEMFKFLGGDSPLEFRERLQQELFPLYVADPSARPALEMLIATMASKFGPAHDIKLEKQRHIFGHLGLGSLLTFMGMGAYYMKSPESRAKLVGYLATNRTKTSKAISDFLENTFTKWSNFKKHIDPKVKVKPGRELVVAGPVNRTGVSRTSPEYEQFVQKYGREPIGLYELMPDIARRNIPNGKTRIKVNPSRDLVVAGPLRSSSVSKNSREYQEFVKKYGREPIGKYELMPEAARTNIPRDQTRISIGGPRINPTGSFGARNGRKLFTAMSKMKENILGTYLRLSPAQQIMAMGRAMILGIGGGTAISGAMAAKYHLPESQFNYIPQDEMSRFIRPVAILDLTCRAEALQIDIENTDFNREDAEAQFNNKTSALKSLIEDYRFLLGVASMYTNEVDESLRLPPGITSEAGQIRFTRTHEGETFEMPVSCPSRQGRDFTAVSLKESRKVIENIRDNLLSLEVELRNEVLNQQAAAQQISDQIIQSESEYIAEKILEMSASGHNQMVSALVAQAVGGDNAAQNTLMALDRLMKTIAQEDGEDSPDLEGRLLPSNELGKKEDELRSGRRRQSAAQDILDLPVNAHNRAVVELARKTLKGDATARKTLEELDKLMENANPLVINLGGRFTPDEAMQAAVSEAL